MLTLSLSVRTAYCSSACAGEIYLFNFSEYNLCIANCWSCYSLLLHHCFTAIVLCTFSYLHCAVHHISTLYSTQLCDTTLCYIQHILSSTTVREHDRVPKGGDQTAAAGPHPAREKVNVSASQTLPLCFKSLLQSVESLHPLRITDRINSCFNESNEYSYLPTNFTNGTDFCVVVPIDKPLNLCWQSVS